VSSEVVEGKYSIELFKSGGEGAGVQEILYRHDSLAVARSIYRSCIERYSGRLQRSAGYQAICIVSARPSVGGQSDDEG
jgi:hypothetical protein